MRLNKEFLLPTGGFPSFQALPGAHYQMDGEILRYPGFSRLQAEVFIVLSFRNQRSSPRIQSKQKIPEISTQAFGAANISYSKPSGIQSIQYTRDLPCRYRNSMSFEGLRYSAWLGSDRESEWT